MYTSFNARAVGLTLSAIDTVELTSLAGFDGVDLMVRDLSTAGERPETLRKRMNDLGVIGGAFPLPVNWRGDELSFRRDLADLDRHADVAATLGLTRTGTWVMPEIPERLDGPSGYRDTLAFHLDRLGAIAQMLESRRIRLGLEVIGVERFRSGRTPKFITRIGGLAPVLHPLSQAHANVGVLLDTFHLFAADDRLESVIALGVEAVVWVHVADLPSGASTDRDQIEDPVRGLPGDHGSIDNQSTLRPLKMRGFNGPVTAEPLAQCASIQGLNSNDTAVAAADSLWAVWPS